MIEVGWGDTTHEYYVLVVRGKWTSAEMADAIDTIYTDVEQYSHGVNIIIDVRYAGSPPHDIIKLFSKSIRNIPENINYIVLVNRNAIWLRLYEILKRVYSASVSRIYFVKTVSEAYQLIIPTTPE